tara:strand:+ start:1605 stop:3128 length:1524 start_codon:yes stop_codon:yes gene_type:complete
LKKKSTLVTILTLILITFGAKFLGFLREVMIAQKFGTSSQSDSFFIALTLTTLLGALIGQSMNTVLIPLFSELKNQKGYKGKNRFTNNMLTIIFIASILIVLISYLLSPIIVGTVAFGFEIDQYNLTLKLFKIGLLSILFTGIMSVFRAYLQSENKFNETALSEMAINASYLFFLFFYADYYGIVGLMFAGVFGCFIQVFIQYLALRSTKFSYRYLVDFKDLYLKKVLFLSAPIFLTVIVSDINKSVDKALASTLIEGSVSALSYGNRINIMIFGVFITSITTVFFTDLSKLAANKSYLSFKIKFQKAINLILILTIPITIILVLFSNQIVTLLLERGVFDSRASSLTASALIFYSLGLTGLSCRLLLIKTFFALQMTKTPMINSIIAVFFNIVFSLILIKTMQHEGLALASSLSITIMSLLMFYSLRKRLGNMNYKKIIITGTKVIVASSIMGYVSGYCYESLIINNNMVISLMISLTIGFVTYLTTGTLLKIKEFNYLLKKIKIV